MGSCRETEIRSFTVLLSTTIGSFVLHPLRQLILTTHAIEMIGNGRMKYPIVVCKIKWRFTENRFYQQMQKVAVAVGKTPGPRSKIEEVRFSLGTTEPILSCVLDDTAVPKFSVDIYPQWLCSNARLKSCNSRNQMSSQNIHNLLNFANYAGAHYMQYVYTHIISVYICTRQSLELSLTF